MPLSKKTKDILIISLADAEAAGEFSEALDSATNGSVSKAYVDAANSLLVPLSQKGTANGVVPLDSSSKIPSTYLSAIAVTDTFVVATQAAMLALVAQTGDVAIRSDLSKSYILQGSNPTVLSAWTELLSPSGTAVQSVNGKAGPSVTLTTTDIAEGTNLYYTSTRFDSAFALKTTSGLAEGTNLYYTAARFNSAFAAKSTTDLSEGIKMFYTQTRFDSAFTAKSTTDLAEGTNLYHTVARAKAAAVANSLIGGVTDVAPSQDAVIVALAAKASNTLNNLVSPTSVNQILNMNNNKISGLGAPVLGTDAATKAYADSIAGAGGGANKTLSNLDPITAVNVALNMGANKIAGLGTPTLAADATTKDYVDTSISTSAALAANKTLSNLTSPTAVNQILNMSTNKISGLGTPTVGTDAATKAYADALISTKVFVRCTTASGQSIPNGVQTVVNFNTKEEDVLNTVTTGAAWRFTAPYNGIYRFTINTMYTNTTYTGAGIQMSSIIKLNGTGAEYIIDITYPYTTAISQYKMLRGTIEIRLIANEYIDYRLYQGNGTSVPLFAGAAYNSISILKIAD